MVVNNVHGHKGIGLMFGLLKFLRVPAVKAALHKRLGQHRVGEFLVDYGPISPEEIAQDDPELIKLYENSKRID